jgi:hypothetical protein
VLIGNKVEAALFMGASPCEYEWVASLKAVFCLEKDVTAR